VTTVYFVRHAQADNSVREGRGRPLTDKGWHDRALVTAFLADKRIEVVVSSPFKRAVDTVADFAERYGHQIETIEDFRERRSDSDMRRDHPDFLAVVKRQIADFGYTYSDGESLEQVQARNIGALNDVLDRYAGKTIAIGTHGVALSTMIGYYDDAYGIDDFWAMMELTPWVVRMDFDGRNCVGMVKADLFAHEGGAVAEACKVRTAGLGALKGYRFVVVFARYQGRWLYCRAKKRDSFETAGGHIECGETPLDAARRELYEETGAVEFDIRPIFDYSVHRPTEYSNGQVFLADVRELGDMPGYEMAETRLFDGVPDVMRFPQILPVLFEKVKELT